MRRAIRVASDSVVKFCDKPDPFCRAPANSLLELREAWRLKFEGNRRAFNDGRVDAEQGTRVGRHCRTYEQGYGVRWGLTFGMSGGATGAKRPLACPLDGAVKRQCHEQ